MKRSAWALALVLPLAGCVTMGKPFNTALVPTIQNGKSTDKDVEAMFGSPYRQGIDDGDRTWTYLHYKLNLFGDRLTRDLYVRFNKDGTVKSYSFNTNFPEDTVK